MKLSLLVVLSTFFMGSVFAEGEPGLSFNYYEGNWSSLPDFNSIGAVKSGFDVNVSLNTRNRNNQYGYIWYGAIEIPTSGTYTFESNSDDGSKVYIGDFGHSKVALVNNDGLHATKLVSGTVYLNAGKYPFYATFFQNSGDQTMEIYWSSNSGISRQRIPNSVFTNSTATTKSPSPTNGSLTYSYYEGNWNALPNFSSLTPVKTGTSNNFDLGVSNRSTQYAISWKGSITLPANGVYTFETTSDDGSKVYINNWPVPIVSNDGLHGSQTVSGNSYFTAGTYAIEVTYFQAGSGQTLEVYWSSNTGIARQKIPNEAFTGTVTVAPPVVVEPPNPTPPTPTAPPTDPYGNGGLTGVNNYYFSSSSGDDSRSSSQAQNPNTPWRTISKLNSVMSGLRGGDAVLFKRGETFDGTINVSNSGGSGSPIIFSSYGSGIKPVISGFMTLSNWSNLGNGVWETNCPSLNGLNMVTLNGTVQPMGRYPNINAPSKGYLTLEGHSGTSQITDNELSGNTNWTGAEIVIRKNNWVIDRGLITWHGGNTLNFNSPSVHESNNGYGYFIQNSPQTLDQLGEWYYDVNQKKVRMYFGSNNPSSYTAKAGILDNTMVIDGKSNILIDNLSMQGADVLACKIQNSQNIRVQNSDFNYSGYGVLTANNSNNVVVESTTTNNTNNTGLFFFDCNNSSVRNSYVQNTGLIQGMGQSDNGGYQAIHMGGSNNVVELNSVINTGYCGITFSGDNVSIKNNFVNHFTMTKDDGAGIYTWGELNKYNRYITGNIIMNGIGVAEGTFYTVSSGSSGITLDDATANVDITNNTVANCSRAGIFIHNSHEVRITGNTVYNNSTQVNLDHDDISPENPIRNMAVNNNILFAKSPGQYVLANQSLSVDFSNFGSFNNNFYTRPVDEGGIINNYYKDPSGKFIYSWFDLEGWKTVFNHDWNSYKSPVKVPSYVVNYLNGSNKFRNGEFTSDVSGLFCLGNCGISLSYGRLDGGALQISPTNYTKNNLGAYLDIGAVNAGTKYVVRFSAIGSSAGKTMRVYGMKNGGAYEMLSDMKYIA
ncbi:MAG: PA14 domain-containing protein, partial [Chitinophagaceae bacterium]